MTYLEPSQFLEVLLKQQCRQSIDKAMVGVRKFNTLADELSEANCTLNFGFIEFREFMEKFHDTIPNKKFQLQIVYSENLVKEVTRFNEIYESVDNVLGYKDLWKHTLK